MGPKHPYHSIELEQLADSESSSTWNPPGDLAQEPPTYVLEGHPTAENDSLKKPKHYSSLTTRLSRQGLAVLVLGTILIVIAVSLLIFLWFGTRSSAWANIMINGRAPLAITLTVVALRLSMMLQLGALTSMLAAVALEKGFVPFNKAATVSILRASYGPPQQLATSLASGKRSIYTIIIASLATIIGFLTQFSSTILVSDLGTQQIPSPAESLKVAYEIGAMDLVANEIYGGLEFWKTNPQSYPTFAEYSEPPVREEYIQDTGLTLRSMLPFPTEPQRTSLRYYSGMTTIMDSRVTCVRPRLKVQVERPGPTGGIMHVSIFLDQVPPQIFEPPPKGILTAAIPCSYETSVYGRRNDSNRAEWKITMCNIPSSGNMISPWTGLANFTGGALVLNVTDDGELYPEGSVSDDDTIEPDKYEADGPWQRMIFPGKFRAAATVCFFTLQMVQMDIEMSRDAGRQEPRMAWDKDKRLYNTSAIMEWLGVTGKQTPASERGLLSITPKSSWKMPSDSFKTGLYTGFMSPFHTITQPTQPGVLLCSSCPGEDDDRPHRARVYAFQDVLQSTGNIALAIQSLWTMLTISEYYDRLERFDHAEAAKIASFEDALVPVGRKGFFLVMTILLIHFICVASATTLFLRHTRISILGASWQSVSQIAHGEGEAILDIATRCSDKEVDNFMASKGISKRTVLIRLIEHQDKSGLKFL